ncbi:MAG: ROK family protein [Bacteroidales bacterium]|nr:ROK family protein [Bacteroidales bacterium]
MAMEITVGIDIGGTNTVLGVVDRKGNVIEEGAIRTTDFPVVEDFVKALTKAINDLLGSKKYVLKGIGIGAPNGNYHKGTIELAPNLKWKGIIPLAGMVEKSIGKPVFLTNDANAAALGEMMFGGAREMKDFIILTLGTGLGSGIVVNGEVIYGHTGFAGEYGHIIMFPGGRDCGCGRQGCLETYVSATGIVRTVQWLLGEMRDESKLRKIHTSDLTSKIIADAARKKDPVALEAFDYTAEVLAYAIVNAVVVTSPEAIFLFGGLSNAGNLLFDPVRKYIDELILPVFKGTVSILPSGIPENNAAVLGSAALAWKGVIGSE